MHIVELEKGVWLADGEGDPARTLVKENAMKFKTNDAAAKALNGARFYHPFKDAVIDAVKKEPTVKAFRIEVNGHEPAIVAAVAPTSEEARAKAKFNVMNTLKEIGYATSWKDIKSIKRAPEYDIAASHSGNRYCRTVEFAEYDRIQNIKGVPKIEDFSESSLKEISKKLRETFCAKGKKFAAIEFARNLKINIDDSLTKNNDGIVAKYSKEKNSLQVAYNLEQGTWITTVAVASILLKDTRALERGIKFSDTLDRYNTSVRFASYILDPSGMAWDKSISMEESSKKTGIPIEVIKGFQGPLFEDGSLYGKYTSEEVSKIPYQSTLDFCR